jgi:DNA-binding XRE family transcriptional regulator
MDAWSLDLDRGDCCGGGWCRHGRPPGRHESSANVPPPTAATCAAGDIQVSGELPDWLPFARPLPIALRPSRARVPDLDERPDLTAGAGSEIRKMRERRGLTQLQLADAVGMSRTSITNIEQGNQRLAVTALAAIAEALQADLFIELRSRT